MSFIEFLIWALIIIVSIPLGIVVAIAVLWGVAKILIVLAIFIGSVTALAIVAYVIYFIAVQMGWLPPG
jgi:ABC-type dipeptide/oligopeptide/nickel transport system permease component